MQSFIQPAINATDNTDHQKKVFRQSHTLAYGASNTPAYAPIAKYIEQGFKHAYGANIKVSSPVLLAIQNENIKGALGLRNASCTLFSEQYLDTDIVTALSQQGIVTERSEIVEISSLYSDDQRMTVRLLTSLIVGLDQLGYRHVIFTATSRLFGLLVNFGLSPAVLCDADQSKLASSSDDWGSYYDTKPQVVAIDVNECVKALNIKSQFLGPVSFMPNEFHHFNAAIREFHHAA